MNIEESNASVRYEPFSTKTRLPWQHKMDASVLNRLFSRITQDKIDKFISILNELSINERENSNDNNFANTYWALDSTSISTHSRNLTCSAYGHNKDGDELHKLMYLWW